MPRILFSNYVLTIRLYVLIILILATDKRRNMNENEYDFLRNLAAFFSNFLLPEFHL